MDELTKTIHNKFNPLDNTVVVLVDGLIYHVDNISLDVSVRNKIKNGLLSNSSLKREYEYNLEIEINKEINTGVGYPKIYLFTQQHKMLIDVSISVAYFISSTDNRGRISLEFTDNADIDVEKI